MVTTVAAAAVVAKNARLFIVISLTLRNLVDADQESELATGNSHFELGISLRWQNCSTNRTRLRGPSGAARQGELPLGGKAASWLPLRPWRPSRSYLANFVDLHVRWLRAGPECGCEEKGPAGPLRPCGGQIPQPP